MKTMQIPVNLTLEVARYVVGLGHWVEFEAMVRCTQERIPEARAISVWLDQPYLPSDAPRVLICAEVEALPQPLGEGEDPREKELDDWMQESFPQEVSRHFIPMIIRGYIDDEG